MAGIMKHPAHYQVGRPEWRVEGGGIFSPTFSLRPGNGSQCKSELSRKTACFERGRLRGEDAEGTWRRSKTSFAGFRRAHSTRCWGRRVAPPFLSQGAKEGTTLGWWSP